MMGPTFGIKLMKMSLYFVHSFAVKDTKNDYKHAKTEYGGEKFISYIEKNIYGAQFHPEKAIILV